MNRRQLLSFALVPAVAGSASFAIIAAHGQAISKPMVELTASGFSPSIDRAVETAAARAGYNRHELTIIGLSRETVLGTLRDFTYAVAGGTAEERLVRIVEVANQRSAA